MRIEKSIYRLTKKFERETVPFTVEWELTNRCNLNCLHCLRDTRTDNELSIDEIKDILVQVRQENCLNLILTGGELFLRLDIFEILRFAKNLGFGLTILSNATLLDENKVKMLKKLNIFTIQISLYGITREAHEYITCAKGSFDKTMHAIQLLEKYGVPFHIATMCFNRNFHELKKLKKIAKRNHWNILFDFVISPTVLGCDSPLSLRATNEQLRIAVREGLLSWNKDLNGKNEQEERYDIGLEYRNQAHLSSAGKVYPSVKMRVEVGDLRRDTFHNIWRNSQKLNWLRSLKREEFECFSCKWYNKCCWKPGLAFLEHRNFKIAPKEICRINNILQSQKRG